MGEPARTPSSRFAPSLTQDAGSKQVARKPSRFWAACPIAMGRRMRELQSGRLIISATFSLLPKLQSSAARRSEEHTSELQSRLHLVCRLLLEKKKKKH